MKYQVSTDAGTCKEESEEQEVFTPDNVKHLVRIVAALQERPEPPVRLPVKPEAGGRQNQCSRQVPLI